jgi:hypothetical protein
MTDGLANTGDLVTSKALLNFARKTPTYLSNIIHSLGFWRAHTCLNADLLKGLSQDTTGIFHLGSSSDCLASFLGDVFADHYFRREKVGELPAGLISEKPMAGFVVRADVATNLVFEGTSAFSDLPVHEATEDDIKHIFKARATKALNDKTFSALLEEMKSYPFLLALSIQLEEASKIKESEYENPDTVRRSELVNLMSRLDDSQDVVDLRQVSRQMSQAQ